MVSVQNRSKKCAAKSGTNKHTDRIRPIQSSSGTVFWTAKSQIPLADASKTCPENNTPNSLRNPVNGHLRLASVVALSSSGACGAIKYMSPVLKLGNLWERSVKKFLLFFCGGVPGRSGGTDGLGNS